MSADGLTTIVKTFVIKGERRVPYRVEVAREGWDELVGHADGRPLSRLALGLMRVKMEGVPAAERPAVLAELQGRLKGVDWRLEYERVNKP